jgi:hypothetical protein
LGYYTLKTILSVDPGKLGGMALARDGKFVDCWPMPETEGDVMDVLKNVALQHYSESNRVDAPCICYIEAVHAMPKQGVTSTFTFGRGYGFVLGVLMSHSFKIVTVTPQRWQKALGITPSESKTKHKNKLKAKAQELYPNVKPTLKTADALLILEWARKQP